MTSQLLSSSDAVSRVKSLQYELSPHIKEKILISTKKDTEFYDIAKPYKILRKLNVRVTPQLEDVNFYSGDRSPDQHDYAPQSAAFRKQIHEQRGWKKIRKKVELSEILDNFHKGQICFVGPAGSGKTTLLKAISRDVMEGNYENLKDIEIVHFVKCRDFRATDKVTPAEFLFRNVDPALDKDEMNGSLEFAKHNPNKVLFVIDSLDTLQYRLDGVHGVIDLYEKASPATILRNLLANKLIPGSRSITSSREHKIRNYKGDLHANKVIALVGLTEESMKQIITGYLNAKEAEEIISYLKENAPALMSLCSIPVFLTFTLIGFKIEPNFIPSTMSGIMVLLLQSLLHSPHAHAENIEDVINKLKQLAFTGTLEGRVLFQIHELHRYELIPEDVADVTITVPGGWKQKLLEGECLLFFCHQSIQETLTAFHIAEMELEEYKTFIKQHLHTPHYCTIRRILCGILLNEEVMKASQQLLSVKENLHEKQTHLRWSLQEMLRKEEDSADKLELYISINEAGNGMKDDIKLYIDSIQLDNLPLSISDAHAIGSVIHHCTHLKIMMLWDCSLNESTVKVLTSTIQGSDVEITELIFGGSKSLVSTMSTVGEFVKKCRVDALNLSGYDLTPEHLRKLKLSLGDTKIRKLDISSFGFIPVHKTRDDILSVIDLLPNVTEELGMVDWKIHDEDLELLQHNLDQLYPTELEIVRGKTYVDQDKKTLTSHQPTIEKSDEVFVRHKNKAIGVEGGEIVIADSSIHIPRGSLTIETKLSFTIEIAKSYPDLPKKFIPLGPRFTCKPRGTKFVKAGTFKQTVWCHLTVPGIGTSLKVLTKKVGAANWCEIEKDVVVNKDGTIEFPCEHFCKFAPVIDINSNAPYRFGYFLCRDNDNNFAFVYFLYNDNLMQILLERYKDYTLIHPAGDEVKISPGGTLSIKLTAHTAGFQFCPATVHQTTINENTDKSNTLRLVLDLSTDLGEQSQRQNRVKISFQVNEKIYMMNVCWYPSNQPSTSETLAPSTPQNYSSLVQGSHITLNFENSQIAVGERSSNNFFRQPTSIQDRSVIAENEPLLPAAMQQTSSVSNLSLRDSPSSHHITSHYEQEDEDEYPSTSNSDI